jgi:ribosomal protein L29
MKAGSSRLDNNLKMIIRRKDIKAMNKEEKLEKIKELELELIKARANAVKGGKIKIREIKRTIAKLMLQ